MDVRQPGGAQITLICVSPDVPAEPARFWVFPGAGSAGAARGVIGLHVRKRDWHVSLPVAVLVLRALAAGIGGQAGSRSAGSSGRPTSARIRWLIASVIPKVSH